MDENLHVEEKTAEIERKLEEKSVVTKYRNLRGFVKYIPIVTIVAVILLSINWTFDLRFFANVVWESYTFYYLIVGLIAPLAFL